MMADDERRPVRDLGTTYGQSWAWPEGEAPRTEFTQRERVLLYLWDCRDRLERAKKSRAAGDYETEEG